ncbi:SUR7/PalI family-domain-containing protein [Durotheca rogersii]|uniref:SUR7/PalI family-domain-containing protein n=1 Tax=Durotheca rogersii TaxID=419775 RepID=UPI0022209FDD|nr:SUR7/PalI family-domain-containing protein [Durotheca rogersii]KAI5864775.1 SUR7/PalI family-domain-containing protein [Durotheca rogersii]
MGAGRYICVALPFILTVASIVCMLIVGLAGVANQNLYLFRIDVTDLSISPVALASIIGNLTGVGDIQSQVDSLKSTVDESGKNLSESLNDAKNNLLVNTRSPSPAPQDISSIINGVLNSGSDSNVTAAELGLANTYDFTLWGFCATAANGTQNCTQARFDWATDELNIDFLHRLNNASGLNVTIPQEVEDSLTTFKTLIRWTEVVYVIAIVGLGIELVIGLFTACSRAVSCLTWLVSGIATLAVIAAASMMTAVAIVPVGLVVAATSQYGGRANVNGSFLAVAWLAVAFGLGASLFWLFSVCCCKPESRASKRSSQSTEGEKFLPAGTYAPLGDGNHNSNYSYGAQQRGGARSDLAYEPYSHAH